MNSQELIKALRKLKVETGSLACWGCGHEHNCGIHGCRVMREAADLIENQQNHIAALMQANDALRPRWIPVTERLPGPEGRYIVRTGNGSVTVAKFYPEYGRFQRIFTHWLPLPAGPEVE